MERTVPEAVLVVEVELVGRMAGEHLVHQLQRVRFSRVEDLLVWPCQLAARWSTTVLGVAILPREPRVEIWIRIFRTADMSSAPIHPRWIPLLRDTINANMAIDKGAISYAIATLDNGSTSLPSVPAPSPRVRFVVHRGFVNERRAGEDVSWSGQSIDRVICGD